MVLSMVLMSPGAAKSSALQALGSAVDNGVGVRFPTGNYCCDLQTRFGGFFAICIVLDLCREDYCCIVRNSFAGFKPPSSIFPLR